MFVVIAVAAVCLATGVLTGKAVLLWVAAAMSLAAVAVFGWRLLRRQPARVEIVELASASAAEGEAADAEPASAAEAADVKAEEPKAADEPEPAGKAEEPEAKAADEPDAAVDLPEVAAAKKDPAELAEPAGVTPGAAEQAGPDAGTVRVIPGRRRFHLAGCALIVDKATEEILLDEAREEGFTACTVCHPGGGAETEIS